MNDEQKIREKLHIVKMLRMLAILGMQCGVTHPIAMYDGKQASCLMVDKFMNLYEKSYYKDK